MLPHHIEALDAWRSLPIKQQPQWPDADRVADVSQQIATLPPLVFAGEVDIETEPDAEPEDDLS